MDLEWTDELLSDSREVVEALAEATAPDFDGLVAEVLDYRDRIHAAARPLTDLELADELVVRTIHLLRAARTAEQRELAGLAARYLLHEEDDDLGNPYGFDDDLEVFNAVASRVAPELVLEYV
jgi:hypothetical protein